MRKIQCLFTGTDRQLIKVLSEFCGRLPWLHFNHNPMNVREASHYLQEFEDVILFADCGTAALNEFGQLLPAAGNPFAVIYIGFNSALPDAGSGKNVLAAPFSFEQFFTAVKNAECQFHPGGEVASIKTHDFIFIKSEYKFYKVNFSDILFCEGMKDYTQVYLANRPKPVLTLQNLKTFISKLPQHEFIRVHRSYAVSLRLIDVISRNEIIVGKKHIPIGESYRNALFEIVGQLS